MFNYILLEATVAKGIDVKQIALIASFVLVFYFFMIRPQQKRQKDQRSFIDHIKKGDNVVTIGGIHGKIHDIEDNIVTLEVDTRGTKISVSKSAISIEATKKLQQPQK
ncbi:MAG: preprotein translocase subunit YajC [Candidatus Amoebophilus sp.]